MRSRVDGPRDSQVWAGGLSGETRKEGEEVQVAAIMTRFWGQEKQINVITHRLINVALTIGL